MPGFDKESAIELSLFPELAESLEDLSQISHIFHRILDIQSHTLYEYVGQNQDFPISNIAH